MLQPNDRSIAKHALSIILQVEYSNKDQSNLAIFAKGGIAVASPPNVCIRQVAARDWRFGCNLKLHVLVGVKPQISPTTCGQGPMHLTQCVIGRHKCTCQMASKSVERFNQGERMWQTDRQTDHALEICVGIRGVACAARAMPPRTKVN